MLLLYKTPSWWTWTRQPAPSGSATAMGSPFHHAGDGHELVIDRYLHNDQLGSLVHMADASGILTVEGDVTDLAGAGARFRVVAPVGTDQDSGEAQLDPWTKASRWLWAGYMYEPPLVGYTTATGIERKAPAPTETQTPPTPI